MTFIRTTFEAKRGETFNMAVHEDGGTGFLTGAEAVTCWGRPVEHAQAPVPEADDPPAFTMAAEYKAASGEGPARWELSLDAAETLALPDRHYVTDVRVERPDGTVIFSATATLDVVPSVSGAAP